MRNTVRVVCGLAVLVGTALVIHDLFPRIVTKLVPGHLVVQYDTVRTVDTAWVAQLQTDTVYLERVVVSKPETVLVVPHLYGLTALSVAPKVGDSTRAIGFELSPGDSGRIVRRSWGASWWTAGPLTGLSLEHWPPAVAFGPPPPKGCGLACALKKYVLGGAIGYVVGKL